ncbi:Ubp10p [Sugiyamaella lignohabitans]|uniref:ubiquitinyl hydrolase 1 n=1 Tax=Sugiyamaella lignohabitans TaxID=796027 RepID=A0A167CB96_9ASCO|nr:Ubp10p [Sugiyamaella lignohabitans]ANB11459.1 Ubp10p [Sugiyamaella lignohabitans]
MVDISSLTARDSAMAEQILSSHLDYVPARKPETSAAKPASYVLIKPSKDDHDSESSDEDEEETTENEDDSGSSTTVSTPQSSEDENNLRHKVGKGVLTPLSSPDSDTESDDDELNVGQLKYFDAEDDQDEDEDGDFSSGSDEGGDDVDDDEDDNNSEGSSDSDESDETDGDDEDASGLENGEQSDSEVSKLALGSRVSPLALATNKTSGNNTAGAAGTANTTDSKSESSSESSSAISPMRLFYDINESTTDKGSRSNSHIVKSWRSLTMAPNGLENRSVTCYMNAAMQAIFHVPAMAHYLMDIAQSRYKNTISNSSVSSDLAGLLKRLYEPGKKRKVYPIKIIRRLPDINCMMSEWQQEDSHEYFMSLISRLQEDSVPKGKKLNSSIIHEIFGGNIDQKVTCKTCGHVSTTHQDFYDLPVSFSSREAKAYKAAKEGLETSNANGSNTSTTNNNSNIQSNTVTSASAVVATNGSAGSATTGTAPKAKFTLEGSIQDFFSPELIKPDAKNKSGYQCEKCKNLTSAIKISRINDAPEYLTVHIKRFKFQGSHSQKLKETMKYPLDLDLTKYSVSGEPIKYRLVSVIVHEGRTVSSGHYIALCRQPNNTWAEYDDECVRKVSEKAVLRQNSAYMLIYSRLTRIKQTAPTAKPLKTKTKARDVESTEKLRDKTKKLVNTGPTPSPARSPVRATPSALPLALAPTPTSASPVPGSPIASKHKSKKSSSNPTKPAGENKRQLDDEIDQIFNKKTKVF